MKNNFFFIDNYKWPRELFIIAECYFIRSFEWRNIFACLNDIKDIEHSIREEWIREGFKIVLGYEVEFVGQYETQ